MSVTIAGGTKIEWADYTFNPWWGCEKVSPGCAHCYAETLSNQRQPGKHLWGAGHGFRFFEAPHWAEPFRWARVAPAKLGRRPRVFCASMADVFEERRDLDEARERLIDLICGTPELDWLLLTKRPEFARDWFARWRRDQDGTVSPPGTIVIPTNIWLGVSIENTRYTWRADVLREIPAAVRFISAEPLLASLLTVRPARDVPTASMTDAELEDGVDDFVVGPRAPLNLAGIDWLIVGGESGAGARSMALPWARELVAACRADGVAPFVKQLGAKPVGGLDEGTRFYLPLRDRKGGDIEEFPDDLRIREFPEARA